MKKTLRNQTAQQVLEVLSSTSTHFIVKVPIDPLMHQKPGELFVPIALTAALQIIENAHNSARYDVVMETTNDGRIITIKKPQS